MFPMPTILEGPRDILGRPINDQAQGFDLTLITYRVISQTKSLDLGELLAAGPLP